MFTYILYVRRCVCMWLVISNSLYAILKICQSISQDQPSCTALPLLLIPPGTRSLQNDPPSTPLPSTSLRRTSPSCTSTQVTVDSHQQLTCWGLHSRKATCCSRTCKGCTSPSHPPQTSHPAASMKCPQARQVNDMVPCAYI